MNPLRYVMAVILAASIVWIWPAEGAWGQAEASPALPVGFAPRPVYLVTDPDESPPDDRAITPIGVRAEIPGRLALVEGAGGVLALDEGEQPVVLHDWRHATDEPVPDTPFRVRFLPAGAALGVERLLRVRAGEPQWLTLQRSAEASGWRLTATEPGVFAPLPSSLAETPPALNEDAATLERELAALLQREEGPPPSAEQLREEGLQMIVEGEYVIDQYVDGVPVVEEHSLGEAMPGREAADSAVSGQVTLGGLVTIHPPGGWMLEPGEQEVTLRTETVYSAAITLRRGRAARDALVFDDLFQGEPDVSTGSILGQSAQLFSGPADYVGMQSGMRMERGEVRVYLLEQCLPDGAPVMIETMAAPGWLQDHDLPSVMAAIEADWPKGMRPCHPAVTARATWALKEVFAFVLPQGFETGRSRSSYWIRTTSGPYASLGVGTGPDSFPSAFQRLDSLGNGFIAAPEARRVTLMGEPATLFVGRSQAGEESRVQHVALLDRCLPDATPVVVTLRADDAWLSANDGFEALLNRAWLFLPESAPPCDPSLLQTALEVSGATPVEGIEAAEGDARSARGVTAGAGSPLSAPGGDEDTAGLAGAVFPVLDGDMSNWTVTAAEFEASAAEITANPGGEGLTSYYVAPALARGDWSSVQALQLDKKSHGGSYYADGYGSEGDIVLEGVAGRAVHPLPEHHSGEWRRFEIPLDGPGWSLSQGVESLEDVLRSVTALRIRAEYGAGTDHSGLRNVRLIVSNQMAPAQAAEQLREQGLQFMLDGDYETALDRLERSLALRHDEALADRIARLRLFLKVRPEADPATGYDDER